MEREEREAHLAKMSGWALSAMQELSGQSLPIGDLRVIDREPLIVIAELIGSILELGKPQAETYFRGSLWLDSYYRCSKRPLGSVPFDFLSGLRKHILVLLKNQKCVEPRLELEVWTGVSLLAEIGQDVIGDSIAKGVMALLTD